MLKVVKQVGPLRYAIYYTPAHGCRFERLGASWLGRDAFTGAAIPQPPVAALAQDAFQTLTAEARRYGFHATLKAPFSLKDGVDEPTLVAAFETFAQSHAAFAVADLKVVNMKGFLAIVPDPADPVLDALAAAGVREFDRYRAALTEADLKRRREKPLTPRQDELLVKWGYPYVFEEFRFHMTLSERIMDYTLLGQLKAEAEAHFAEVLIAPVWFDTIGLFVEREPGGPFEVLSAVKLIDENPKTAKACLPA